MASRDFDPERMLAALEGGGIRFVLVGGMAAILHGDVGVTVDVDIVPEHETANLRRLATVLRQLDARIRAPGAPHGLSFDCSAEFLDRLAPDAILNLTTTVGDIDLTFQPSGTRGYADLRRDAIEIEVGDRSPILVASLADIIRSKEAAGREKDRRALPRLRRLLDRIQEGDQPS